MNLVFYLLPHAMNSNNSIDRDRPQYDDHRRSSSSYHRSFSTVEMEPGIQDYDPNTLPNNRNSFTTYRNFTLVCISRIFIYHYV